MKSHLLNDYSKLLDFHPGFFKIHLIIILYFVLLREENE